MDLAEHVAYVKAAFSDSETAFEEFTRQAPAAQLAVAAHVILLTDPKGALIGGDKCLMWSFSALLRVMFEARFKECSSDSELSRRIIDASRRRKLHKNVGRRARLTPPEPLEELVAKLLGNEPDYLAKLHRKLRRVVRSGKVARSSRFVFATCQEEVELSQSMRALLKKCQTLPLSQRRLLAAFAVAQPSYRAAVLGLVTMDEKRREHAKNALSHGYISSLDKTFVRFKAVCSDGLGDEDRLTILSIARSPILWPFVRAIARTKADSRPIVASCLIGAKKEAA